MDTRILQLLKALPPALCAELLRMGEADTAFFSHLGEIRLRARCLATVSLLGREIGLPVLISEGELAACFRRLCGESVYLHETSLAEGYISFAGIRIGVAGTAVREGGAVVGLATPQSLCIRIPHAVVGAGALGHRLFCEGERSGMLIYSPPGIGKTTFLSDLARSLSLGKSALSVALIDTRCELYDAAATPAGARMDVLRGYPIAEGILQATRNLAPDVIVCDELARPEEAEAILCRAGCGVPIIASAHAKSEQELYGRPPLVRLLKAGIFRTLIGIAREGGDYRYRVTHIGKGAGACFESLAPSF